MGSGDPGVQGGGGGVFPALLQVQTCKAWGLPGSPGAGACDDGFVLAPCSDSAETQVWSPKLGVPGAAQLAWAQPGHMPSQAGAEHLHRVPCTPQPPQTGPGHSVRLVSRWWDFLSLPWSP